MKDFKFPKGEELCVTYHNVDGTTLFMMTEKALSDSFSFSLYEVSDDTMVRLGRAKSPFELEEKFDVMAKCMV